MTTTAPTPIDPVAEAAYVTDQRRADWPATIAGFEAASAEVARLPGFEADVVFGPHPRQRYDLLPARGPARGVVAYFHPGWWQMRDKTLFRCLMPLFSALGCDAVMVGYPLCPDVALADLTQAARAAVPALVERATRVHGRALPIVAAGHSAGGHLAVELASTEWTARGFSASPIAGVVALSGVYDLAPLVATSLNVALRLDPASARAASPLFRVPTEGCPALFAVGGGETAAFLDQNRRMHAAWAGAGHAASAIESADDDHFSLITRLLDEDDGPLRRAVADLVATAIAAGAARGG